MSGETVTRRDWVRAMVGAGLAVATVAARRTVGTIPAGTPITVYKDPNCGCCKSWVSHLQGNGFTVASHDRNDMDAIKDSLGVPKALRSCHTAIVGKLIIEGHVPARDIMKAVASPPKGVVGLAVPGMPAGSPGMEVGTQRDRYEVLAFTATGATKVFASHG